MNKINTIDTISALKQTLHQSKKRIVLVGGCFDILHVGHIRFFTAAKKQGDTLIVLLESDQTITNQKGPHRPINTQEDRAEILGALEVIDHIIILKPEMNDKAYDELVFALKPAIIATTAGDHYRSHKERQAKAIGAEVVDVIMPVSDKSTTRIVEILQEL